MTINGDKVEYYPDKNMMVGEGNVEVIYEGMFLYADKITVWMDKEEALAEGNVKLVKDGTTFYGEKMRYYLKEKRAEIIKPSFKKYGPWYGKGKEAEEEKDKYIIKDAYVTTCNRKKPHYRFQAKIIKVYLHDRIIARNVIFYIKDTPVFYLPYFSRSLKDNKSPFMIIPGKNDDWGWYVLTAYRYYINDNNSGRLRLDYREKKGLAHGFDHSYRTGFGEGLIRYYYMNEKDSLYEDNDRFRISIRHRWEPDAYTSIYSEYNKMSDIDFLKDYFYEEEYEKDPQPETYFYLIRRFPHFTMNLNVKKRVNHFFTEVERLPEIGIDVNDLRIKKSNFYYSSKFYFSNLTHKNANSGLDDDVWRFDTYNEISHVRRWFGFLNFTPYAGVRETFYSKNKEGEEHKIRGAFYTGFDTSMKFYKIMYPDKGRFLFSRADAVRHVIMPILSYAYITRPTILKDSLMQFDDVDSIERKNRFTLTLENLWQVKYKQDGKYVKRDLLRFDISADYDFKIEEGSRWQQASMKLEYLPYDWLRVESEAQYDIKPAHFNTASFDAVINKDRWQLGLGQRYENNTSSQLTAEFKYKINKKWTFRTYQRYEFENSAPERQEFTLYRDLHCWLAEFTFVNNRLDGNKTFFVIFTIKAFPQYPFRFAQSYHPPEY